jgi:AraC-like DNA-binding protein
VHAIPTGSLCGASPRPSATAIGWIGTPIPGLRTLQRLFQSETRLTLETWRARARMQQAVVALSNGALVIQAALDAGYQSPSAFIAAFKRAFGVTPARYRARAA